MENKIILRSVVLSGALKNVSERSAKDKEGKDITYPGYSYINISVLDDKGFGKTHMLKVSPKYLSDFKILYESLKGQDKIDCEVSIGDSNFGMYELLMTNCQKSK